MISAKTFIERFEAYCPLWLAEPGDPVGLHIGSLNKEVQNIMMTLDVRPEVVTEAIEKKVDLIVAKHPPIFRPIKRLTDADPQQQMYLELVKYDIAVYAAHTNMDIIWDGLNDWFCEMLDVKVDHYLTKTHEIPLMKLAVYTPLAQAKAMRVALGKAGAGQQGNYQSTSYTLVGTGRFTPETGANPTIGHIGQEEAVQEARIEVVFPETIQNQVLAAMYDVHPYEEPAFDLFQLDNQPITYGIGRVGDLATPLSIEAFTEKVQRVFDLEGLRLIEPLGGTTQVKRIAICGGSGEKFYPDALRANADVYLTGDISYHTAHDMQANGLTAIDPGHNIEKECIPRFIQKFNEWKREAAWDVTFIPSETNTNPFQYK